MATTIERAAEIVAEWQAQVSRHRRAAEEELRAIGRRYECQIRDLMNGKLGPSSTVKVVRGAK